MIDDQRIPTQILAAAITPSGAWVATIPVGNVFILKDILLFFESAPSGGVFLYRNGVPMQLWSLVSPAPFVRVHDIGHTVYNGGDTIEIQSDALVIAGGFVLSGDLAPQT